jgi:hypothetical protein
MFDIIYPSIFFTKVDPKEKNKGSFKSTADQFEYLPAFLGDGCMQDNVRRTREGFVASECYAQSGVLPSMSVNSKVTFPVRSVDIK